MKVIREGNSKKTSWSKQLTCTGRMTNEGGCGGLHDSNEGRRSRSSTTWILLSCTRRSTLLHQMHLPQRGRRSEAAPRCMPKSSTTATGIASSTQTHTLSQRVDNHEQNTHRSKERHHRRRRRTAKEPVRANPSFW